MDESDDISAAARDIGLSEEDIRRLLARIEEIRREKAGRRGGE
jgi:molybdenum-dependent DNA-binding transcriptional regulator ModE